EKFASSDDNNRWRDLVPAVWRGWGITACLTRRPYSTDFFESLSPGIAFFKEAGGVQGVPVVRGLSLREHDSGAGALVVAAQHVRIALIVENRDRRPDDADCLSVSAISQIKPAQAIVRGGKTKPGLGVARMQFDGAAEMLFSETVVVAAETLLAEIQFVVRVATEEAGFRRGSGYTERSRHCARRRFVGGLCRRGHIAGIWRRRR